MTSHRVAWPLLLTLIACAASDDKPKPAHTVIPGGGVLTLTPGQGNLLTCTGKVTADEPSAWTTEPFNQGTYELNGPWHAPTSTSQGGQTLVLKATADANTQLITSGTYHVATAYPGAPVAVNGSTPNGLPNGIFQHAIGTKAARSYAVWPAQDGTTVKLMLGRSDDGGATWNAPATALSSVVKDAKSAIDCAAIAVDAGNPDVVHSLARISGANDLAADVTLALATSRDGGVTFTSHVVQSGAVGKCPDLVSPAADAVLIVAPDGTQKANTEYVTNGGFPGVKAAIGGSLTIVQNDVESPRLFGDGKGRVCISYLGQENATTTNAYVQCTSDKGTSWTAPLKLDPADGTRPHSTPIGAISADGHAAVVWSAGGELTIATSADGGATFGAPAVVPAYVLPSKTDAGATSAAPATSPALGYDEANILWLAYSSEGQRVVVDKTCDHGKTWSGATLVNGPEASLANARWPALAMTPGDAPHLLAAGDTHLVVYALTP